MTLDQDVAAVRGRIANARQDRARAEHDKAVAEDALAAAKAQLKSDFGVETLQEAEGLLADLASEVKAECERAERLLDEAEEVDSGDDDGTSATG